MQQDFDPRDLEPALTSQEAGGGRGKLIPAIVAVVALVGFGGIVWYAYSQGARQVAGETAPLIKADAGPIKVKPDDPGGLSVPNRDSLLLNSPGGTDGPRVERILPSPEQPLPLPQAPVAAAPAAPTETSSLPSITGTRPPVAAPAAPPAAVVPAPQTVATTTPPPKPVAPPAAATSQPIALTPPPKPAPAPAAAPPAPKPAAATTAGAPIRGAKVQLGSVRSEDAAAAEWAKLQRTHPELSSLSMQTSKVDIAGKGTFFRVQAGPLADNSAASQLCGTLKAKNQDCIVVR